MIWLALLGCGEPPAPAKPPDPEPAQNIASSKPAKGRPGAPAAFKAEPSFQLAAGPGTPKRNLLVISLDTVRADSLALYGGLAEMPAVEALAERGAVFPQAISHFPQTCLSHWSMFTGVLPELHGNTPAARGSVYRGPTVAEIAGKHGYATGAFIGGQTLMDSYCGLSRGFDVYDDAFEVDPSDMRRPGGDVVASAMRWIDSQSGPWFAFVHLFDAHFPYTPTVDLYDRDYTGTLGGSDAELRPYRDGGQTPSARDLEHVRALYDAEVAELDGMIAPLLRGLDEDVIVAIVSDHGESFDHGYYFNHKDKLSDGVLHVPLILAGPGTQRAPVEAQFGMVNLAPTLLELSGLPLDQRMQGSPWAELPVVFAVTDPWDPSGSHQYAERTASTKRVEADGGAECFELLTDPGEDHPLPCPDEGRRAQYRELLQSLASEQAEAPGPAAPMSPEECAALQALGYVDECPGPGAGPRGPGRGGPPPGAPPKGPPRR